jgi:hypothetical protein
MSEVVDEDERKVSRAAALAMMAGFIGASVSASVFELGQAFYTFAAAAAVSISIRRRAPAQPSLATHQHA